MIEYSIVWFDCSKYENYLITSRFLLKIEETYCVSKMYDIRTNIEKQIFYKFKMKIYEN